MDPRQTKTDRRGVVAVVVLEERFLVIRRSQEVVAPGTYCFPGGAVEAGSPTKRRCAANCGKSWVWKYARCGTCGKA